MDSENIANANRIKQNYSYGVFYIKNYTIEQRACRIAHYIVNSKDTARGAAKRFGISKSTVHTERSALQKNIISKYIELPNVSKDSMPVRVTLAVRL